MLSWNARISKMQRISQKPDGLSGLRPARERMKGIIVSAANAKISGNYSALIYYLPGTVK
jgi:hypothetical protein